MSAAPRGTQAKKDYKFDPRGQPLDPDSLQAILRYFPPNPTKEQLIVAAVTFSLESGLIYRPNLLSQHFWGTESAFALKCRGSNILLQIQRTVLATRDRRDPSVVCERCHKIHAHKKRSPMLPRDYGDAHAGEPIASSSNSTAMSPYKPKKNHAKAAASQMNLDAPVPAKESRNASSSNATSAADHALCEPCPLGVEAARPGGRGKKSVMLTGEDWSIRQVLSFFQRECKCLEQHESELEDLCEAWAQTWAKDIKLARLQLKAFAAEAQRIKDEEGYELASVGAGANAEEAEPVTTHKSKWRIKSPEDVKALTDSLKTHLEALTASGTPMTYDWFAAYHDLWTLMGSIDKHLKNAFTDAMKLDILESMSAAHHDD